MPQKAYKRKLPRSQRHRDDAHKTTVHIDGREVARAVSRRSSGRGFQLPQSPFQPYDPVTVHIPDQPGASAGQVSARREVESLATAVGAAAMHVFFFDPRLGAWLRIDWPS